MKEEAEGVKRGVGGGRGEGGVECQEKGREKGGKRRRGGHGGGRRGKFVEKLERGRRLTGHEPIKNPECCPWRG